MVHEATTRIGGLAIAAAAACALASSVGAQSPGDSAPRSSTVRVRVPRGQDPSIYVYAQVGSLGLAKAQVSALRALYTVHTTLSAREREAMRATIAELEEGMRILGSPPLEFSRAVIPHAFYANIDNYRTWPGYTERERLAMEFIRRFDTEHKALNLDEEFWRRMHRSFTDQEIVDMSLMSSTWVGLHFMNAVLGVGPGTAGKTQNSDPKAEAKRVVGSGTLKMLEMLETREVSSTDQ